MRPDGAELGGDLQRGRPAADRAEPAARRAGAFGTKPRSPGCDARFDKMLEQANGIDSLGRFRTMLLVAWYTDRRLGSISALRASDVLMDAHAVERALAAQGKYERLAEHWPAAVRWAAEADK